MTRREAERLLGGHATGTLSETERQRLFAAALDHQELFDALMDEEALRELLADPAAKAQLLEALARPAPPRVVPLWRRTGVLGAAASLLVASIAGLAYLRSPEKAPPALRQEAPKALVAPPAEAPAATQASAPRPQPPVKAKGGRADQPPPEAPPAPAPAQQPPALAAVAPPAPAAAAVPAASGKAAELRSEAQDNLARKAEAPRPAAAMLEVAGSVAPAPEPKRAKAVGGAVADATAVAQPAWTLAPLPGGGTRVSVLAPSGLQGWLLRRGRAGVEVLQLRPGATAQGVAAWTCDVHLAEGDRLDLYLLKGPVPDPAALPEAGPVDGFRARIHPAAKKDPTR